MRLDPRVFGKLRRNQETGLVTPVTRPNLPMLPLQASNDGAGNTVTPVTREKPKSESNSQNRQSEITPPPLAIPDVAGALNRPMAYLLESDARLPGLCLMIEADIEDIQCGRLPLENARTYLSRTEAAHPHLAERLKLARQETVTTTRPVMPTLEDGIERLRAGGLELVQDDVRFIRQRIGTRTNWPDLLGQYQVQWLLAAATEPAPHRRQNAGRRAANQWLLEVTG